MRHVPIGPPIMPPHTIPTIAAATASVAAPVTPACSKSGANASPVAGPPVSVTEPASTPIRGGTPIAAATTAPIRFCSTATTVEAEEDRDRRAADPQQRHARAEADRGEERDHQRRLQRRVEADSLMPRDAQRRDRERDQQPADHGRRDVVARQERDAPLDRVADEEHEARRREGVDEVELDHARTGRRFYSERRD